MSSINKASFSYAVSIKYVNGNKHPTVDLLSISLRGQHSKFNISFFKNFCKIKILYLWRNLAIENSKEYKYLQLNNLINDKYINEYYKNCIIKKYNKIHKE